MAEGGEMRGFVFSLVFIVVFSALFSSIPVGFQGTGNSPDTVVPIDPNLVTGFADSENYTGAAFTGGTYEYELDSRNWIALDLTTDLSIVVKILSFGIWLGHLDTCRFVSDGGIDRGDTLAFTEITTDATDGAVRYSLLSTATGNDMGALVAYWNTTTYDNATHAWDNDKLYLLHGIGLGASATNNIGGLLVGLLTFSLPDVPPLINLFLAVPVWACIIFVLWYVIKEMIPFV